MNNSAMKPNRFLQWQRAKKLFSGIQTHFSKGGSLLIATYTKATLYRPKHAAMFSMDKTGVYVQRGKSLDCLNFTPIKFI